jgi:hypothetical protein
MWGTSTGGGNHGEIHYEDGYREKITQNSKPQYTKILLLYKGEY